MQCKTVQLVQKYSSNSKCPLVYVNEAYGDFCRKPPTGRAVSHEDVLYLNHMSSLQICSDDDAAFVIITPDIPNC